MKKILVIKTGGTIAQIPNVEGILEPSKKDYIHKIDGLEDIANIEIKDLGNIDSTDMETNLKLTNPSLAKKIKDRSDIANTIYNNSSNYDGFVVVHGTDTMAETASALTYMLPNFRKPIVLTGSQKSIWSPRSDAENNLYSAIQVATKDYGEVVISFGNHVLRGCRTVKIDEEGYDAFATPGTEPIGKITALKEGVKMADHRIKVENFIPKLFTDFNTKIFNYVHLSGATVDDILINIAESDKIEGFLIGGFGAGNIPNRLLPFIKTATDKYKPVFVYTNCSVGAADMGIYSVGNSALEAGALSAGDMTSEALGQKLMYSVGLANNKKLIGEEKLHFINSIIKTPYNGDINIINIRD